MICYRFIFIVLRGKHHLVWIPHLFRLFKIERHGMWDCLCYEQGTPVGEALILLLPKERRW
ncbi:MAG TPA: hypothetical protein PLY86_08480 [bacterium]|nr:hypothetical protein [bacterium]